jgi:hypothetical protein
LLKLLYILVGSEIATLDALLFVEVVQHNLLAVQVSARLLLLLPLI